MVIALREGGVDVDAILRKVDASSLPTGARMTVAQWNAFQDLALARVEPSLGLELGAQIHPELFGIAGLSAMAAPTFGAALGRLVRYKRMFSTDVLELVPQGDDQALRVDVSMPERSHARLRVDMELAFLVSFGRVMTRTRIIPRAVSLRGPAPAYQERYGALFACPVRFQQPVDELLFSALDLARPLVSSSPELEALFGARAEQLWEETGGDERVSQVRSVLRRQLSGEEPSIGGVARALGMSERSLQRKLSEAHTSFKALLSEVRRDMAREQLATTDIELAELSFLLGFSDPNSLHRAFKRWEGMTPLEYRRKHGPRRHLA
ncbi:AraC family transcriptional regulator [Stigmatella aurantiaca]|nr:AraC family transcriptional regulator [Stigmatella aurantiaca]ADO68621.1 Transcriptional regulator, AraC-like protein [Stigmatella aurantiaca DW4/3-1]